MKDKLLQKFINSWQFKRLSKPQQLIELQEYEYQRKMFNAKEVKTKC